MSDLRQSFSSEQASFTVLLAHEDRMQRYGIAHALAARDLEVVGEAHTPEQVVSLVARTRPDVLLVSAALAQHDDFRLVATVGKRYPATRAIVLGGPADAEHAHAFVEAGAAGFLSAAVDPRNLPALVEEAASGTMCMLSPPTRKTELQTVLSEREVSVLRGAARGLSNEAIGRELWLSPHTVKSHLHRIYAKIDVANRTEAARWALEHQLVVAESNAAA